MISRRAFLEQCAAVASAASLTAGCARLDAGAGFARGAHDPAPPAPSPSGAKPNILWIVLDALRARNLSCYGYERRTSPFIDSLAARGVLFENHYTQGTWTFPSVPTYMAGRYFPVNCLAPDPRLTPRVPPGPERLLPKRLSDAGYHTFFCTTHPMVSETSPLGRSFMEAHLFLRTDSREKTYLDHGTPFLAEAIPSLPRPFFAYLHLLDTHFPHQLAHPHDRWVPGTPGPRVTRGQSVDEGQPRLTDREKEQLRGLYDGSILRADEGLAALMQRLEAQGALENTVVVVGSDHGEALGEDGFMIGHSWHCDEVLHIPLIVAGAGIPHGVRVRQLTENVDIAPTLCRMAGLPPQEGFDGECLPELGTPPRAWRKEHAFSKNERYDAPPIMILRNKKLKCEYDPEKGWTFLWKHPDLLTTRRRARRGRAGIALETRLREDFMESWNAFSRLPAACDDIPIEQFSIVSPEGLASFPRAAADTPPQEGGWFLTPNGHLVCAQGNGNPPEVVLRHRMPPGVYRIYARLTPPGGVCGGKTPGIGLAVGDEPAPRILRCSPTLGSPDNVWNVEAGLYDLPDGVLTVRITAPAGEAQAALAGFRLVRDESPVKQENERAVEQEMMQTLGYL